MEHSKGPWETDGRVGYLDIVCPKGRIAMMDCEDDAFWAAELEANANLIAAAPELLETLQEAVNKGYMWDNDPELWAKASAAIAKAKP